MMKHCHRAIGKNSNSRNSWEIIAVAVIVAGSPMHWNQTNCSVIICSAKLMKCSTSPRRKLKIRAILARRMTASLRTSLPHPMLHWRTPIEILSHVTSWRLLLRRKRPWLSTEKKNNIQSDNQIRANNYLPTTTPGLRTTQSIKNIIQTFLPLHHQPVQYNGNRRNYNRWCTKWNLLKMGPQSQIDKK